MGVDARIIGNWIVDSNRLTDRDLSQTDGMVKAGLRVIYFK